VLGLDGVELIRDQTTRDLTHSPRILATTDSLIGPVLGERLRQKREALL